VMPYMPMPGHTIHAASDDMFNMYPHPLSFMPTTYLRQSMSGVVI